MPVIYEVKDRELSWEVLEKEKLYKVFVTGLPRSGTTLAVSLLEKCGIEMIYNHENLHIKEITENFFAYVFEMCNRPNTGCKLPLMPKTQWLYLDLIKTIPCKVVLTYRETEEVWKSQMKAGYHLTNKVDLRGQWQLAYDMLVARKTKLHILNYTNLLLDPVAECKRLTDFLGFGDPGIAATIVSRDLNHSKS